MSTYVAKARWIRHKRRDEPHPSRVLEFLCEAMTKQSKRLLTFNPLQNPSDAFMDYLEGYASAYDIFPVCSRHDGEHDDILSVVDEFFRVSVDLRRSVSDVRGVAPHVGLAADGDEQSQKRGWRANG